jgi:hypothetical protein
MRVLWAEDASPFLQDAHRFGGLAVVLRPYGGYVHLIPRLIATAVVVLPIDHFAIAISLFACLAAGVVAALTFELSKFVTPTLAIRATLAAAVVLVPAAPIEVLGNTANLHSYCLWLVPWLLLARPASRRGSVALGALGLAISLTEIQTVLFAPFFAIGARDRLQWPKLAGLIAGLVVQAVALAAAPRRAVITGSVGIGSMAKGYTINAFLSLINPQGQAIRKLVMTTGWVAIAAAFLILAAFLVTAAWNARRLRLAILLLVFGSVATFALGYGMTPFPDYDRYLLDQGIFHLVLLRYAAISSLFLAAAVILAAGEFLRAQSPRLGAAVLVLVWASFGVNFHQRWNWRSGGPAWNKSLDGAIADCRRDPAREWTEAPVWPQGVVVEFSCRKFEQHMRNMAESDDLKRQ